jgi:phage recombination protein Bet
MSNQEVAQVNGNGAKSSEVAVTWQQRLDTAEAKKLLINTICPGANDVEYAMLREYCRSTGLNPFQREIWWIKVNGRVQLMTGINGYYAVANRNPQYDGIEVETECDDDGAPIKATAKVWRKDRKLPSVGVARWKEFNKGVGNWKSMPCLMLEKCAEAIALRKAFPQELNQTYTEEEMPREYSIAAVGVAPQEFAKLTKQADEDAAYEGMLDDLFNPDNMRGTYRHLKLKFGTNRGKFVGDKANHLMFLRNHLEKYAAKYSDPEQTAIRMRITDLEQEFAAAKAAELQAQQVPLSEDSIPDFGNEGTFPSVSPTDEFDD